MQRLRGCDAFAIYSETPTSPFVTLKVAIYEPTDPGDPPSVDDLQRFLESSLSILGPERAGLRVVRTPLDLHHPLWVIDPLFSARDHIYHVSLPPPAGKAQLCDFLSDLAGMPLNMNRPLWEIWILHNLDGGRLGVVLKIHHALADGKMVSAMISRAHARKGPLRRRTNRVAGEPIPGAPRLVFGALLDLARSYTVELPHYYRYLKQAREGSATLQAVEEETVAPFSAPWTLLNQPGGGSYRLYRYETFSLADFKTLARRFDCTVNTVVLGVCSEALARYLRDVGELPDRSLVTAMPLGDQTDSSPPTMLHSDIHNNNLAVAIVPLFQNIGDWQERLAAIKRSSRAAIDAVKRSNGRRFDNFLDFLPGTFVRLINGYMQQLAEKRKDVYVNVIISNVPGPREPMYALDGRLKMVDLLSTGNLADGGNLNITVWSYVDHLNFSLYMRKGALPEPERLQAHLRDVVRELVADELPRAAMSPQRAPPPQEALPEQARAGQGAG